MIPSSGMRQKNDLPPEIEAAATKVVDAAVSVHRSLGPGLLESVYEVCLEYELRNRGLRIERQVPLPVVYNGVQLDAGLRIDILVEDAIVLELKAVETLLPVHKAQLLTYLKLTGRRLGFLLNFNVALMKDGIDRKVR
jgi:GxxExxY protein